MSGMLYLVATPIGNLEDITLRAIRVLKEADRIACEDTRHTRKLLEHFGIGKPLVSFHEHNEAARSTELIACLKNGETVALVSDAGMPSICDPGYRLVRAAIENAVPVQTIPGPSALITAMAASGLPTDAFHFAGFLPARAGQRRKLLEDLKVEQATLIFYEAPHRILSALDDIEAVFGSRPIVLARELTKIHEEYLRGTAGEIRGVLAARGAIKGEMTLLVGGATDLPASQVPAEEDVAARIRGGMSRMEAIKEVARNHGLSKRDLYRRIEQLKGE